PPSKRQQFGGTVGGPLRKDRTFYFVGFEGLVRDESSVVSVFTDPTIFDPTPAQNAVLNTLPAPLAAGLRGALTASPATRALFETNSGVFPFPTRDYKLSTRIDHRATDNNQIFFRYNFTHTRESNANVQALVGASRGTDVELIDSTSILGWTHTFNQRTLNEVRLQWNYNDSIVKSTEKFGPAISINGFGFFNRDPFLPSNVT